MISLQLGRAEVLTRDAARKHGFDVRVVSSRWIGKRSKRFDGRGYFRCAEVVIESVDGFRATKQVTLDTNGAARVV